jgi:O-methyltransferase
MKCHVKSITKSLLHALGYDMTRYPPNPRKGFHDICEANWRTIEFVSKYTMTSPERLDALINAVKYTVNNSLQGDIVECGVWRGGSMLAVAKTLCELNCFDYDLYLYDTYSGMPEPTSYDIRMTGMQAIGKFEDLKIDKDSSDWCYADIEDVKNTLSKTSYPQDKIKFIKGKVQDTLKRNSHNQIAILRLDTDWYESTKHEIEVSFPRLLDKGVLIIDDYGTWKGSKKAIDDYFTTHDINTFLHRIDSTGRLMIKNT